MDKVDEVLSRGVVDVINKQHLEKVLRSGKKLRIKNGIDPTGPKIHLGRASQLLKLRQFQEMGHKIIVILGTFTARIGDASDKDSMRPMLSEKQVRENVKDYKNQIGKILDLHNTEIRENSEWLGKIKPSEFIKLASKFTYAQIVERDLFRRRISEGKELGLHEFLYPLMQGYDSMAIKADLEIGGTDQKFNLLIGRDVQKYYDQKPQDIMTLEMLLGTDGRKMSTSWGNVVNITDSPRNMFGTLMSIKDDLIVQYFKICTNLPLQSIKQLESELGKPETNPMRIKKQLAFEVSKLYHGRKKAEDAQIEFEQVIQKRGTPSAIQTKTISSGATVVDVLVETNLAPSRTEAKRLINQKSVAIENEIVTDQNMVFSKQGGVIRVGRKFAKIKIKERGE